MEIFALVMGQINEDNILWKNKCKWSNVFVNINEMCEKVSKLWAKWIWALFELGH